MLENLDFFLNLIRKKWEKHPIFLSAVVFCLVFVLYGSIYFFNSGISAVDDHFFHFKYAYLFRTEGWKVVDNFKWIHFDKSIDEHIRYPLSLYQIALVPFTFVKDMILGLKISDVFWASFSISIFYYIFRKSKIKFPLFYILILLTSNYFLMRMLTGRAFVMASAFVFLEIYWATRRKDKNLFFISFIHILWHSTTFFMPLLIAILTETARYLEFKKVYFKNFLITGMGTIVGMLFYPKFLATFSGYLRILFSLHLNLGSIKGEGNEIYAKDMFESFLGSSNIFFLLSVVSIGLVIYYYLANKNLRELNKNNKEISNQSTLIYAAFLFLLVSIFGSIVIGGRFFDYYFPASVFLFALVINKVMEEKKITISKPIFPYLIYSMILVLIFLLTNNFLNQNINISKSDYRPIKETVQWIKTKSNSEDIIFLRNWSWFPISFFYDSYNVYTMGIEPKGLQAYSQELYWKWYNIFNYNYYCVEPRDCQDRVADLNRDFQGWNDEQKNNFKKENGRAIIESIKNDFHSRLVLSDSQSFNDNFELNSELVDDTHIAKSETSGLIIKAFKLKQ